MMESVLGKGWEFFRLDQDSLEKPGDFLDGSATHFNAAILLIMIGVRFMFFFFFLILLWQKKQSEITYNEGYYI